MITIEIGSLVDNLACAIKGLYIQHLILHPVALKGSQVEVEEFLLAFGFCCNYPYG